MDHAEADQEAALQVEEVKEMPEGGLVQLGTHPEADVVTLPVSDKIKAVGLA